VRKIAGEASRRRHGVKGDFAHAVDLVDYGLLPADWGGDVGEIESRFGE
jgi:hypothetical protein